MSRNRFRATFWFASLAILSTSIPTVAEDNFTQAVRQVLRDHIELDKGSIGMVVGIVDETGSRVISYGKADNNGGAEVDGDTLFEIGSITKTFTALLLQDMVERGEMNLDDAVAKYLPNSVRMPTHGGKEISLLHLVTHTSGLPRDPDNLNPRRWSNGYDDYTVDRLYAFLSGHTLVRVPGAKYEYSNFGMGLLGHVIAPKADTNYESLLQDRICKPLGMESTCITLTPELKQRAATGHDWFGNPAVDMVFQTLIGAGGMHSTANDMLKYLSANLGLSRSHLTPLMEQTHIPQSKIDAPDGAQNQGRAWVSAGDLTWHTGGTSGFAAFAGLTKKQRRGIVVLSNSSAGRGVYSIANLLLNSDWRVDERPVVPGLDSQIYDSYVGEYQLTANYVMSVRREGNRLLAQVSGQLPLELLPETTTDFLVRIGGKSVKFIPDGKGRIKSLISDVNGTKAEFARISDQPPPRSLPPSVPVFPNSNGNALDAFVGSYKFSSGQIINLSRQEDHLIMLPERRGGLELYLESEAKASCPYFQFEIMLLKDNKGETIGLTASCPEPDFTGQAFKRTRRIGRGWGTNLKAAVMFFVAVGLLFSFFFALRGIRRRWQTRN